MALTNAEKQKRYRDRKRQERQQRNEAIALASAKAAVDGDARSQVELELAQMSDVSPADRAMALALADVLDVKGGQGKPAAVKELRSLLDAMKSRGVDPAEALAKTLAEAMSGGRRKKKADREDKASVVDSPASPAES